MRTRQNEPPELDQPVKYLKLNTFAEQIGGTSYFYFMAGKRNNTGLLFNQRFFLIVGNEQVGYAREYVPQVKLPFRTVAKIPTLKASIRIKDVTKCQPMDALTVVIAFKEEATNLDSPPYWILKLETPEVAASVIQRISEARAKQALQSRGVKGMYDGPSGISAFKKQVEGDLSTISYNRTQSEITPTTPKIPHAAEEATQSAIQTRTSLPRPAENPETPVQSPMKEQLAKPMIAEQQPPSVPTMISEPVRVSIKEVTAPPPPAAHTYLRSYYWLEKLLINSTYMEALEQFNVQCNKLVVDLVDREQQTNISQTQLAAELGIIVEFCRNSLTSNEPMRLHREFQNYKYFLARTNGQARVKLPLVTLIQYRGWLALVKLYVPGETVDPINFKDMLKEASEQCRVDHRHWQASLVELNTQYFQTRQKNLPRYFFLTALPTLLPADPFLHSQIEHRVTPECMLSLCEKNDFSSTSTQLIKDHLRDQFNTALTKLDSNQEEVYSYSEVLSLLENYHLSEEYLPPLYKQCTSKSLKQYLWTALCAKQVYQLCLPELSGGSMRGTIQKLNELVALKGELWQQACVQLQHKHQITNPRKDINRCQLAHFIIEMFGLVVDEGLVGERLAKSNVSEIFNHSVALFSSTVYDLRTFNSALWQRVALIIGLEYTESANADLIELLKLQDNPRQLDNWPETMLFTKLRLSLANFAAPGEVEAKATPYSDWLYKPTFSHKPSLWKWKLTLIKIKWLLLENQGEQATIVYQKLLSNINSWSNGKHPILYELLTMMGRFHVMHHQFSKGLEYLENGRNIYQELQPEDLTELVNISTEIADAYERSKEVRAALRNNVEIAKNLEEMELAGDEIFANVQYKIGRQALFLENFELAKEAALKAAGLYYELNSAQAHEGNIVECYQLLSRVAQLNDEELYETICENCANGLGELKQPENVERMLRIVLMPSLSKVLNQQSKQLLTEMIESLPKLTNGYNRAYSYLSRSMQAGTFVELLNSCTQECAQLCLDIEEEGLLDQWRGLEEQSAEKTLMHDFVCLFQALTNFLGPHYILGCLC